MERVESDAEVGDTAPPPRLPRHLLTQELAPHGSREGSRVSSVHRTLCMYSYVQPRILHILSSVPICMCINYRDHAETHIV